MFAVFMRVIQLMLWIIQRNITRKYHPTRDVPGDLLSPRSNCLRFLQNLRLQLSTPWPWGIVRSCRSGRAKDKVQTMISTDIMISANLHRLPPATRHTPHASRRLPAKHCPPYATSLTPPGAWRLQLRKSLDRACRSIHGSISSSEIGSVFPL